MTVAPGIDGRALRDAFGRFPSGVVALCSVTDGDRVGMAASTFVPVSLDPPLVAVCIQKTSTTWPKLRNAGALGISILGEGHGLAARTLSIKSGDRFEGIATFGRDSGALLVEGASLLLESRIVNEVDAGDHLIAVLSIDWLGIAEDDTPPIIFHRSSFHRLEANP